MPCELRVGDRTHSGLVLDLSPTGLFIQTNAKTTAGQHVDLQLSTGVGDPLPLRVEVVRKKVVPPRLLTVTGGGVGVRILDATEAYFGFLRDIGIGQGRQPGDPDAYDASPTPAPVEHPDGGPWRFRVRVKQLSGPRSRCLELEAPNATSATALALEEVGDGWKVLDVEPL
jgi:hypothetical protein